VAVSWPTLFCWELAVLASSDFLIAPGVEPADHTVSQNCDCSSPKRSKFVDQVAVCSTAGLGMPLHGRDILTSQGRQFLAGARGDIVDLFDATINDRLR